MQWMLITVNKAEFPLRKTLITYSKFPAMGYAVYKTIRVYIMKNILACVSAYFHHYCFLRSTCYVMFSHTKFQNGINISHVTFLQCVWNKPHSSSLTNVESLTSNFVYSVQICRREKEKEENNGSCKVLCVTSKRNT